MCPATVACPTCGRPLEWSDASPFRPFCSDRCRLIDLGAWLSEQRAVPGEPADAGSAELDLAAPGDAAHAATGDVGHDDP
jgi:uncharacterized protein